MPLAKEGYDGNAHVERVARRTAAGIREGIQGDVDFVITRQIVIGEFFRYDATKGYACRFQTFVDKFCAVFDAENMGAQKKPRVRHLLQNCAPRFQNVVADFREIIETAEGYIAVSAVGRRRSGEFGAVFGKAPMGVRQPQEFFGEKSVVQPRRIGEIIRQKIIDGWQSRGVKIADARYLHGRGLVRQNGEQTFGRMPRQIDENINLVGENYFCRFRKRQIGDISPFVDMGSDAAARCVLRAGKISVYFKASLVVGGKKRPRKIHDHMAAQVVGNVGDANFIVPSLFVFIGRDARQKGRVAASGGVKLFARCVGVVQIHKIVGVFIAAQTEHFVGIAPRILDANGGKALFCRTIQKP